MIKINISFSKKVPVPGQQYSSLSFHGSLERELSDGLSGKDIQNEFQKGYILLEQTVEDEINRYNGVEQASANVPSYTNQPAKPVAPPPPPKQEVMATAKQLNYINRRGAELSLTQQQVLGHLMNFTGLDKLEYLTKKDASSFIDYLADLKQQRAA